MTLGNAEKAAAKTARVMPIVVVDFKLTLEIFLKRDFFSIFANSDRYAHPFPQMETFTD